MTLTIATTVTSANVVHFVGVLETLWVPQDVLITGTGQAIPAILVSGVDADVLVQGRMTAISGSPVGLDTMAHGSTVRIEAGGALASVTASAVFSNADDTTVDNRGTLIGETAIRLSAFGAGLSVLNAGLIWGTIRGIDVAIGAEGTTVIDNLAGGRIVGRAEQALRIGNEAVVTNAGTIDGRVALGDRDDLFDNSAGLVTGRILLGHGNNTFVLGAGAETVEGGNGTDTLDLSAGNGVTLFLGGATGTSTGIAAGDVLTGFDIVRGSAGADRITIEAQQGTVFGGAGNDTLGGSGPFFLRGDDGDDLLTGGIESDQMFGGTGADRLDARAGDDRLEGGAGADSLVADAGFDILDGGADADTLRAGDGQDLARGGAGGDVVAGDGGDDTLFGGTGNDSLSGGAEDDILWGGAGADLVSGAAGADQLAGEAGRDTLTGGAGNDVFYFFTGREADIVTDFGNAAGNNDLLQFETALLPGLAEGPLAPAAFRLRTDNRAQDADDRFIFRTTDTTLWYDADGRGGMGPRLMVDLQPGARLTAADILIFND